MGNTNKMKNNIITFGIWEAEALLINNIASRIFLNYPREILENSGTAGWIQFLYVTILAFLAFMTIEKLYSKMEGKDILDVAELAGGRFLRILAGSIFIFQFLFANSVLLREYVENMKIASLSYSPVGYVSVFFLMRRSKYRGYTRAYARSYFALFKEVESINKWRCPCYREWKY